MFYRLINVITDIVICIQKNKKDCKNSLAPEVSKGQAASLSAQ